jgi:hypothetical protein
MTVKVTPKAHWVLSAGHPRNRHRSAQRDGDCFGPLAMTGNPGDAHVPHPNDAGVKGLDQSAAHAK